MPDYSLVPVDYQPDFDDYSLVPVNYDPFAADGVAQQSQIQQVQAQPQGPPQQQPATGAGQPDAGAPVAGGGPSGSEGGGIGPRGAPNPILDQGAAEAAPFGGYSLVPVDYQPDFGDYSLVPVDYDPFAEDGLAQQAQFQQPPAPTQPAQPQPQGPPQQQPATGAGQPGVNGPTTGNSPSGSGGGAGVGNAGSDPSNPTWALAWSPESAAFDGYSNPTPTQPLTDDQLALIRQKIVESAQKQIGSTDWDRNIAKGNFPKDTNKCNLFVHEMLTGAGASPGTPNGWRHPSPPSAGQWADPSYKIPGWRALGPGESPQPADVAAQPGNYSDATGHVVIVGPNNTFIGVGPPEHPEIPGDPEKIESIPKKDNIVRLPARGPLLYRRFVGQ